jgi:hypothetical protein
LRTRCTDWTRHGLEGVDLIRYCILLIEKLLLLRLQVPDHVRVGNNVACQSLDDIHIRCILPGSCLSGCRA